jgi:hypothetical protein
MKTRTGTTKENAMTRHAQTHEANPKAAEITFGIDYAEFRIMRSWSRAVLRGLWL